MERQELIDAYHLAMAAEQRWYDKVKLHGPGIEGFKPEEWAEWLEAISRTTAASKALREGFADSVPPRN